MTGWQRKVGSEFTWNSWWISQTASSYWKPCVYSDLLTIFVSQDPGKWLLKGGWQLTRKFPTIGFTVHKRHSGNRAFIGELVGSKLSTQLTSSQFARDGITLKALGSFPDLYLAKICPTLWSIKQTKNHSSAKTQIWKLSAICMYHTRSQIQSYS